MKGAQSTDVTQLPVHETANLVGTLFHIGGSLSTVIYIDLFSEFILR